jgi:hydrogenase maturation protein HypF
MSPFTPCNACSREYADPRDRRFHAETIACANCGPSLALKNGAQHTLFTGVAAIHEVVRQLRTGAIVAIKGIGGYQLLADASADATLVRLRKGKARPGKPLALLFDSLSSVAEICDVSGGEAQVLNSPEKPIVILRRKHVQGRHEVRTISPLVAPHSSQLGVMLPASPLHHVLMSMMGRPLVATSGNRHGEPICIDERTAFAKLHGLADVWLVHDRQILHRVDDAVVRISGSRPRIMRLGRGYAPLALEHRRTHVTDVLAVGGQEKNAFAVTTPQHIVLSQHIGDLDSPEALSMLARESRDFATLLHCRPTVIVMDLHPDYQGARTATADLQPVALQHHHAHALSCILEHGLMGPVLAFSWDGAGYGGDQTIWGGEILLVEETRASRLGSLRSFSLPGGEQAMREPRRSALGLLCEVHGNLAFAASPAVRRAFTAEEQRLLVAAIHRRVNAPRTSSIGRLFDVAASILDLCQIALYSEQAPVALECIAASATTSRFYHMAIDHRPDRGYLLDWEPLVEAMLEDFANGVDIGAIARGFHEALADSIATIAMAVSNPRQVVLTGGVFQNALLTSLAEERLDARGFRVYTHGLVPAGDGGLAAGQALYGLLTSCDRKAVVCV